MEKRSLKVAQTYNHKISQQSYKLHTLYKKLYRNERIVFRFLVQKFQNCLTFVVAKLVVNDRRNHLMPKSLNWLNCQGNLFYVRKTDIKQGVQ